jgi:uncharacterized protein (TIGR00369 family)
VTAEQTTDAPAHGTSWGARRTKVVSWHDPAPTTVTGLSMPGIEYMMVSAEPGRVVFTCQPDESAYNPIGTVHGGLVCTLLDSVAGCALHSALPQGKGYTSIEIKVNYLKAVRASSGLLTATGTVLKSGARVGFTEGVVTDVGGTVVATASSTLLVFDL